MARNKIEEVTAPNPIDVYIGAKLKARRLILGLSQEELAKSIGLTFQQVQKYERGTNRISVSRLVDICRALKTPVDYFFDGAARTARGDVEKSQSDLEVDTLLKKDVLELVRAYTQIKSPQMKKQILEMAKVMSGADTKVSS